MRGRLAALLLGLVLVALIEGGLRLIPALDPPAFALQLAHIEGRALHAVNPDYARRFFADMAEPIRRGIRMTPRPYIEPAPEGALRVLFAGGSTVQGYPHPKRLSAPSYLQEMLGDLFPERQIEVFNAGITAAASFAVARAVEDGTAALGADLVVVYTGHNELYGVYGAASLAQGGQAVWMKRVHYALVQWRLRPLVGKLIGPLGKEWADGPLIEVMSKAGAIPAADPRRAQAAANLETNLRDVAAFCRARHIPLVLCTVTSNERGFAPAHIEPPLLDEERARYVDFLARGHKEQASPAALAALEQAEELYADDAYLHFLRGHHLEQLGRGVEARAAYMQARELDPRPWRATAALNEVVRRVAAAEGVLLADVEARFRAHSPEAGVGWELMVDHLHPVAAGQVLLARAIVAALEGAPAPWQIAPGAADRLATADEYRRRLGDLPGERLAVLRAMAVLLASPPLDVGNEGQVQTLRQQAVALWDELSAGEQSGVERWRTGEGPELLALNVADACYAAREYERARAYYRAAHLEEPYTIWGDLWSTLRYVRCGQLAKIPIGSAERSTLHALLDRLRFLSEAPDFSLGLQDFIRGYTYHLLGEHVKALAALESAVQDANIRKTFTTDLLELIVAELIISGRLADAERYAVEIAAKQGQEAFGRALVEQIRASQKPR
ncbi:MAG: GDSL-type esterase/lipase family protein [Gemmatimonadota bacterium]|nr:GDSL-type esterase/lipase family protein [Gemmatimonadota bacterium]